MAKNERRKQEKVEVRESYREKPISQHNANVAISGGHIRVVIPDIPPSVNAYWCTRQHRPTGRPTRYLSKRAKEWKQLVGGICRQHILSGRLCMHVTYYLPDNRRRDLDNLSKGVLDSLEGIYYEDDRQIYQLKLEKKLNGAVRTEIEIYMLEGEHDEAD